MSFYSPMYTYSELIQTAFKNYQQGSRHPVQESPGNLDSSVSYILLKQMKSRLPVTDILLLYWCQDALYQALATARRGQLQIAIQLFKKALAPLQSDTLSTEGNLICRSYHEVAEAYLNYRQGDFNQARNRLFEGLSIDVLLEEKYGYKLFCLHRLQIALHIVRIEVRSQCLEQFINLACQLLNYLEGTLEVLSLPGSWESNLFKEVLSPELAAAFFAQTSEQVALALAGKNSDIAHDLFTMISHRIQIQGSSDKHYHSSSHAWFDLKQAFVNKDISTFLEKASHFLAEGRSNTPLLWYATVVDLVTVCDDLNLQESESIKREIASDAVNWKYLPKSFLPLLGVNTNSNI
jgi:hypothetical protein